MIVILFFTIGVKKKKMKQRFQIFQVEPRTLLFSSGLARVDCTNDQRTLRLYRNTRPVANVV